MADYRGEKVVDALKSCGIPEDLPEVVFKGKPAPPASALKRVKDRTLERIQGTDSGQARRHIRGQAAGNRPFPGRIRRALPGRRFKMVAAAVAAAVFMVTAWLGPAQVWAGLQRALSLVPGFGLLEREGAEFTLLAAERVRLNHGGGHIQVSGLLAQPEGTFVSLYIYRIPGINDMTVEKPSPGVEAEYEASFQVRRKQLLQMYLLDQEGREYRMGDRVIFSWAEGNRDAHVSLQLPPLNPDVRQVTLVIPMETGEEARIHVPLVSLEEQGEWAEVADMVTAGGITVSASAHFSEDTRISLFILPDSDRGIDSIGRFFGGDIPASRPASLTGSGGEGYEFLRQGQAGWQPNYFELYFEEMKPGEEEATFSIPVLLLREEGRARVKVPVPRDEVSHDLNQEINLGRFPLTLVRAEVVSYDHGDALRVYVDLGPAGEETLESFTLEYQSWGWTINRETGRMEYFEVALEGNPRHMNFTLTSPVYSVEGPWEFTFPVE